MRIYYQLRGAHYHMRVFLNGANRGNLCCREEEWRQFQACFSIYTDWIEEKMEPFWEART